MEKSYNILKIVLIVVLTIGVIAGIAGGAFYLGQRSLTQSMGTPPTITQSAVTPMSPSIQPSTSPTSPSTYAPLFSGKVQKLNRDLGLFKLTDSDKLNDVTSNIVYYEAGVFLRGTLAGYTRILAMRPSEGPGPSLQYVLATKDYTSFILDDPDNKTVNYPESDWDNPYMYIDKSKIAKTASFDTEHPKTITLNKPYGLIKTGVVLSEMTKTGQKDKNGNDIYLDTPTTQFDQSTQLASSEKQLSLHAGMTNWGTGEGYSAEEKKNRAIEIQYLTYTTSVYASDSTGLTYSYILSTQKDINTYLNNLPAYEAKMIEYKKQVALVTQNGSNQYPDYPERLLFPGMQLAKTSAGLSNDYYNTYETAFPGACGGNQDTPIVNSLKDDELEPIVSSSDFQLYTLKDAKHPLYELQYLAKATKDDETFGYANSGKRPSYDEYLAKHPLLFFKDAWSRWGVLGEFDIKLMGGCGKPVVYLYPEKSTNVHLSFASPVDLSTQIPTYHGGWYVHAKPDGSLTDLQPQHTSCADIQSTQFGSEYARAACETNSYPYIYWSGRSERNEYPKIDGGWVVARDELAMFMDTRLEEIGLTDKESSDMTSYWVPIMMDKHAPYYRVSFLQKRDMNELIPMIVNPQPDSILRIFLDWEAMSTKPDVDLEPQHLEKFVRHGFSYVEWGGLK